MALIEWPDRKLVADAEFDPGLVYLRQKSEWGGATRAVEMGPAATWTVTINPIPGRDRDVAFMRAFFARLSKPANWTRAPFFVDIKPDLGALAFSATPTAGATSAAVAGGQANQLYARAGEFVTVALATGSNSPRGHQALILTEDIQTDGAGHATMEWAQPLRTAPGAAAIEYRDPFVLVRGMNMRWKVGRGRIHTLDTQILQETW